MSIVTQVVGMLALSVATEQYVVVTRNLQENTFMDVVKNI